MHADYIGETDQPYTETPDQSDYLENSPRQIPPRSWPDDESRGDSHSVPAPSETSPAKTVPDAVPGAPKEDHRPPVNVPSVKRSGGWLEWIRQGSGDPNIPEETRHWIGPKRDIRRFNERSAGLAGGKPPDASGFGANSGGDADLRRYSLWAGLNAPMLLPTSKVSQVSPAQASADSRADYGRKILGERDALASIPGRSSPVNEGVAFPVVSRGGAIPSGEKSRGMFIGVVVDISRHPGEYRDALAQLSQSAGFASDGRFPPVFEDEKKEKVQLWGWIPSRQLHSLINIQDVTRLEVDQAPIPAASRDRYAQARMLLALRVPPMMLPQQMLEASVARWGREDGFVLERTVGIQRIPNSSDNAVIVAGRLPVNSLDRLLADPAVVKMMPLPETEPVQEHHSDSSRPLSASARLISFVVDDHPLLLLLTAFLSGYWILKTRLSSKI